MNCVYMYHMYELTPKQCFVLLRFLLRFSAENVTILTLKNRNNYDFGSPQLGISADVLMV